MRSCCGERDDRLADRSTERLTGSAMSRVAGPGESKQDRPLRQQFRRSRQIDKLGERGDGAAVRGSGGVRHALCWHA